MKHSQQKLAHNSIVLRCISSFILQTHLEMGLYMFYMEFIPKVGVLKNPSNRERKPLLERRSLLERRPLLERRHSGCRRCCSRISSAHSDSGFIYQCSTRLCFCYITCIPLNSESPSCIFSIDFSDF